MNIYREELCSPDGVLMHQYMAAEPETITTGAHRWQLFDAHLDPAAASHEVDRLNEAPQLHCPVRCEETGEWTWPSVT